MTSFNESSDDEDIIIITAALAEAYKPQHDKTNNLRGGQFGKARSRDLNRASVEETIDKDFFVVLHVVQRLLTRRKLGATFRCLDLYTKNKGKGL